MVAGGDDATDDSTADVGVTPSAPSATDGPADATTPQEVENSTAPPPAATTVPPATVAPVAAVGVEVCAADASDALRFGVTESGLYVVTPTAIKRVENDALAACSIDVASAPDAGIDPPIAATDAAGFGTALALSAPSGGIVINQATGLVVNCAGLTGPASVTDDGALYVIDGDVIVAYTLDRTGCTPADAASFAGISATSIAAGGRNRRAVTGTDRSSGATRLWVANGASDVTPVDGLGSADGVIRCGDSWCVIDVAANVIHVVDLDGALIGEAPLSDGLPAPVAELLDLTAGDSAGTFALVQLGDGSTTILRLVA